MLHCAPAGLPESSSNNHSPAHHKTTLTKLLNCCHRPRERRLDLCFSRSLWPELQFRKCPLSRHTTNYTDYHFRNRGITAQNHHTHVPAAKTLWHSTKDTKKAPSACLLAFMTHMVLVLGGSRRPLQVLQGISHDTRNYTRRSCREGRQGRTERVAPRSWEGVRRQNDWLNL